MDLGRSRGKVKSERKEDVEHVEVGELVLCDVPSVVYQGLDLGNPTSNHVQIYVLQVLYVCSGTEQARYAAIVVRTRAPLAALASQSHGTR